MARRPSARRTPPRARLREVAALILDCDGVLTTGEITYREDGSRALTFWAADGLGLGMLRKFGIQVAVLSGRPVDIVERRHRELGIEHFVGPCKDKAAGLSDLCRELRVEASACAFVGDDLADLGALLRVGCPITVPGAPAAVVKAACWQTRAGGGRGAVREVCDAILAAKGLEGAVLRAFAGSSGPRR